MVGEGCEMLPIRYTFIFHPSIVSFQWSRRCGCQFHCTLLTLKLAKRGRDCGWVGWGWVVQGLEVEGDTVALAQLKSIAEEWKTTGRVGKTAQTQFGTFHIFALVLFWLPIFRRRGEPIIFIPTWHFLAAARRSTSRWLLACFGRGFSKGFPAAFERKNRLSGKLL